MWTKSKYYSGNKSKGKFFTDLISDKDGVAKILPGTKIEFRDPAPKDKNGNLIDVEKMFDEGQVKEAIEIIRREPPQVKVDVFFKIAMRGKEMQPPFADKIVELHAFKEGVVFENLKPNSRFKVRIYGLPTS